MTKLIHSVVITALAAAGFAQAEDQKPLSNDVAGDYTCQHPPYQIQMLNKSPLVIYIEDFITPDERAHLQSLAQGHFKHSAVLGTSGSSAINSVRTSQSTTVQRDAIVRCVEERALLFQGHEYPESHLEPIQLVKYAVTEHYHFHTDWFTDVTQTTAANGGNRVSSFFAYVKADNVTGGGTNFPLLTAPRDEKWCRFVDCDVEYDAGVTFKPIEGNAVFWVNMDTGKGDGRTLHAGLPVVSGEKIGMNIWTREGPLGSDIRGI